jgi:hypothetical protein
MWLEESVWLWLPIAGGVGVWIIWSLRRLRAEVRQLQQRLAALEAEASPRRLAESQAP